MISHSCVILFKCLKVNKRREQGLEFYMKFCRSDSVEWQRGEYLQEEFFIPFLQAHSSALLPGALSDCSSCQRTEELVSSDPELHLWQQLSSQSLRTFKSSACPSHRVRKSPGDSNLQPELRTRVSLYYPSGALVFNNSVLSVLKIPQVKSTISTELI